jgi:excisionase family DNA binding protein
MSGESVSVNQAAELLDVHRNTVYRLLRDGELPARRLAGRGPYRIEKSDVGALLRETARPGPFDALGRSRDSERDPGRVDSRARQS